MIRERTTLGELSQRKNLREPACSCCEKGFSETARLVIDILLNF
jgi:hypothetical protein